jgi:hypothetical protein
MRASKILAAALLVLVAEPGLAAQQRQAAQPAAREAAIPEIPPEMKSRYVRLQGQLRPSARDWVASQARLERRRTTPDLAGLKGAVRARFPSTASMGADVVAAVAFIVLMEAANDAEKDMASVMAGAKAVNKAKDALRAMMNELQELTAANAGQPPNAPCRTPFCQSLTRRLADAASDARQAGRPLRTDASGALTYGRLRQIQPQLGEDLNGMNEMSETLSLRLQMTTDRRAKFIATLSNIMKSIAQTNDGIVGNLK